MCAVGRGGRVSLSKEAKTGARRGGEGLTKGERAGTYLVGDV